MVESVTISRSQTPSFVQSSLYRISPSAVPDTVMTTSTSSGALPAFGCGLTETKSVGVGVGVGEAVGVGVAVGLGVAATTVAQPTPADEPEVAAAPEPSKVSAVVATLRADKARV